MTRPCVVLLVSASLLAGLACLSTPLLAQVTIYRCTDAAGDLTVQNNPCPAGTRQREQRVQDVAGPPAIPAPITPGSVLVAPPASRDAVAPTGPLQSVERSADGGFVTTSIGAGPHSPGNLDLTDTPSAQAAQRSADGGFISTSVGPEPRILDSANLSQAPVQQESAPVADRLPPPPIFRCTVYDGDSYLSEDEEAPPRCLPLRTVGLDGNPATGAGMACEVVRDRCARVPDGEACQAWRQQARQAQSRWRFAHPDNVERRHDEYERLEQIIAASCG